MAQDPFAEAEELSQQDQQTLRLIQGMRASDERSLRLTLGQASEIPSGSQGEVFDLAGQTGLPPAAVRQNIDQVRQRANGQRFPALNILKDSPQLATFLKEDVEQAALVQDELERMGVFEWLLTQPVEAHRQGRAMVDFGLLSADRLKRELTAPELERLERLREEMDPGVPDEFWFQRFITGSMRILPTMYGAALAGVPGGVAAGTVAAGLGQLGPQALLPEELVTVPTMFAFGMAAGASTFAFNLEAGLALDEFLQTTDDLGQPMDPAAAKVAAALVGTANAGLEVLQLGIIARSLRGIIPTGLLSRSAVRQLLRKPTVLAALGTAGARVAGTLTAETATEVMQELNTVVGGELAKALTDQEFTITTDDPTAAGLKPNRATGPEILERLADTAIQTVESMALLSLLGPTGGFVRDVRAARRAQDSEQAFAALAEPVAESEALKAAPDVISQWLSATTEGGPVEAVYADVETFESFAQSANVDPADLARELTGNPTALADARATGESLRIKVGVWATKIAGTEHQAFWEGNLRYGAPDQMTPNEGRTLLDEITRSVTEAQTDPEIGAVRGAIVEQLQDVVGFTRDQAEAQAGVVSAPLLALSSRLGIDPAELIGRPIRVLAPEGRRPGARRVAPTAAPAAPGATTDAITTTGQERGAEAAQAGVQPVQSVSESVAPARESDTGFVAREAEHFNDVFDATLTNAQRLDPSVDADTLRAEFDARIELFGDLRPDTLPGTDELSIVGISPETRWWEGVTDLPDLSAFEQRPLEEEQPDLPGGARDLADALAEQPTFDAPFALTGEFAAQRRARDQQQALFDTGEAPEAPTTAKLPTPDPEDDQGVLFQAPGKDQPRGRIEFGEHTVDISLLATADFSTFAHEMGHFWLKVLQDKVGPLLAEEPETLSDGQRRLVTDLQIALDWLGVTDPSQIGEQEQEQWARGFEAYLRRGEAPSVELRSMFERFKSWLETIYTDLRRLDVELSPEVVGVMDRLFASDEAIRAAKFEAELAPLFVNAEKAGMTEERFANYSRDVAEAGRKMANELDQKLLAEQARESQDWWKNASAEIREFVADEVHQRPVYQALFQIRDGTTPAGEALGDPQKLNTARVAELGHPTLDRSLVDEKGEEPDLMADTFGFERGTALLDALAEAPEMESVIDANTDARMKQLHGDMMSDGRLPGAAEQAVSGEHRGAIVRAELEALANEVRRRQGLEQQHKTDKRRMLPPAAVLNQLARERVAAMTVRELRPGVMLQAAQRAASRAFDAMARDDVVSALEAKRQELTSLAVYREMARTREHVQRSVKWVRRHNTPKARQRTALSGESYLEQWDGFLAQYEFAVVPQHRLDRRSSLREWVAAQERAGHPVNIPPKALEESRRINFSRLDVETFRDVTDAMRHLVHLSRLKNRLIRDQRQRTVKAARQELISSIIEHGPPRRPKLITSGGPQKSFSHWRAEFSAEHRKFGSMAHTMDGGEEGGIAWDLGPRVFNEAANNEQQLKIEAGKTLAEITKVFTTADLAEMQVSRPVDGIKDSLSRMERIMVAMYYGNKEGRQQILQSTGWTRSQGQAVIDTLNERDWAWINGTLKLVNSFWPEAEAQMKRLEGIAPRKVPALPIETSNHGQQPGGYFPLLTDPKQSRANRQFDAEEVAKQMMRGAFVSSTTARGHLKERLELAERGEPLWLSISAVGIHINQVIHDLTHREALYDVNRIWGNREVQAAIDEHYGPEWSDEIKILVKDVAAGDIPSRGALAKFGNYLLQGATMVRLGGNVMTAAIQLTGLVISASRLGNGNAAVGSAWLLRAANEWGGSIVRGESIAKRIMADSSFMRNRGRNLSREIRDVMKDIQPRGAWAAAAVGDKIGLGPAGFRAAQFYGAAQRTAFIMIMRMQQIVDVLTFQAAENKALAAGETNARALEIAEQVVIDTQGTGFIKDLSGVQRNPIWRLWTQHYSFFNVLLQNINERVEATRRVKDPTAIGLMIVDVFVLVVALNQIEQALRRMLSGKDDEDESLIEQMVRDQVSFVLNLFVGTREASGAAEGFRYSGPAGAGFMQELTMAVVQFAQFEVDEEFLRSVNRTSGFLLNYPAILGERVVNAYFALEDGAMESVHALFGKRPEK